MNLKGDIMPQAIMPATPRSDGGRRSDLSAPAHDRQDFAAGTRGFTKPEVAELSAAAICNMSADELSAVVRAADVALFAERVTGHLEYYDRRALERLAFLARRTVRNQGY